MIRYTNKISSLEEENNKLYEDKSTLESNLQENDNFIEEFEKKEEALNLIDKEGQDLYDEAAKVTYQEGLNSYQSEEYNTAVIELEKSLEYSKDSYFTDDAHFYLIQSYKKTEDQENYQGHLKEFMDKGDYAYIQSPYRDDVQLSYSKELIKLEQEKEAESQLNYIIEEYPEQWTAKEALALKSELKGG